MVRKGKNQFGKIQQNTVIKKRNLLKSLKVNLLNVISFYTTTMGIKVKLAAVRCSFFQKEKKKYSFKKISSVDITAHWLTKL